MRNEKEFEKLCLKAWEETKERIKDSAPEDFKRLNEMSYEIIIDDYLLTKTYFDTENLINVVEAHLRASEVSCWERAWLEPYCSVHRDNIETFLLVLKQNYGSLENYLDTALCFKESHRRSLRKVFLE